ncbi:MAG TPA: ABC transporter substrate-binding protein [Vicinamibacterales bacterium]|nr:ABC transporter substrate-binding protein [Vicinamibacterales bacterium]
MSCRFLMLVRCRSGRCRAGWTLTLAIGAALCAGCGVGQDPHILTFAGSAVGAEGQVIRRQLDRFQAMYPSIKVEVRITPDAADQRHQLYVQWLNAHAPDPDVLQLDVVWTPEFAAAGWIVDLDQFHASTSDFFPAAVAANRWKGAVYALPWFIDVGMLYWRSDLVARPPVDIDDLERLASAATAQHGVPFGLVWQGARYEGLVTVFLEYLGAFGGRILDDAGRVALDADAAVAALTTMRDEIVVDRIVPAAALTWQEEQVRFAFQNGQAVFMRNWPYAVGLLQDGAQSRVAGRFRVASMPAGPGGAPTSALGGSVLAINAHSGDRDLSYRLIDFLLQPEQLLERARVVGQYPPRPALYDTPALADALQIAPHEARGIIERAVARPATPVYTELSEILQIALHRALTDQQAPRAALAGAAAEIQALLDKAGLGAGR